MRKILLQMRVTDFKARPDELVEFQPMQTIINRMKASSRHITDNFHEGFYGGFCRCIRWVSLKDKELVGALAMFRGMWCWPQRAFGQRLKLVLFGFSCCHPTPWTPLIFFVPLC